MDGGLNKMPCEKYEGAQRRLCFATTEWKNWDDIIHKDLRVKTQTGVTKLKGVERTKSVEDRQRAQLEFVSSGFFFEKGGK